MRCQSLSNDHYIREREWKSDQRIRLDDVEDNFYHTASVLLFPLCTCACAYAIDTVKENSNRSFMNGVLMMCSQTAFSSLSRWHWQMPFDEQRCLYSRYWLSRERTIRECVTIEYLWNALCCFPALANVSNKYHLLLWACCLLFDKTNNYGQQAFKQYFSRVNSRIALCLIGLVQIRHGVYSEGWILFKQIEKQRTVNIPQNKQREKVRDEWWKTDSVHIDFWSRIVDARHIWKGQNKHSSKTQIRESIYQSPKEEKAP